MIKKLIAIFSFVIYSILFLSLRPTAVFADQASCIYCPARDGYTSPQIHFISDPNNQTFTCGTLDPNPVTTVDANGDPQGCLYEMEGNNICSNTASVSYDTTKQSCDPNRSDITIGPVDIGQKTCSKAPSKCRSDNDCQDGTPECTNYICVYQGTYRFQDYNSLPDPNATSCKHFDDPSSVPTLNGGGQGCYVCAEGSHYESVAGSPQCTDDITKKPVDPSSSSPCSEGQVCVGGSGCTGDPNFKNGENPYSTAATPTPPCTTNNYDTSGNCKSVSTGLGVNINTNVGDFIKSLLGLILSISGAIAILLIIISGYRLMISQGNPEKIQAAKDQLTAAIVGLMFVIFSLVILQVIGYDILRLPGFGG